MTAVGWEAPNVVRRPDPANPAAAVSLCMSGFDVGWELKTVLADWIEFFGSRPGEIVYIDGGSRRSVQKKLLSLLHSGHLDKLHLLNPRSWENSFHRCFIQEYQSGKAATLPYIAFVKPDTLAYRMGFQDWLLRDLGKLDDPSVFALTLSHLIDPPSGKDGEYHQYNFASLNFSLMKRESFHAAMHGECGPYIADGFRGGFPESIVCEPAYRRGLVEWAWQQHCIRHGLRTLARAESNHWTIFHINKYGRKLMAIRDAFRSRRGIEPYFDKVKGLYRPPYGPIKQLGVSIEQSIRRARRQLTGR